MLDCVTQLGEQSLELAKLVRPQVVRPNALKVIDQHACELIDFPAARRQSYPLCPAIIWIRNALNVAMFGEVRHQLPHRLYRDVGMPGQVGDSGALIVIDVFEDRQMRWTNRRMPIRGEALFNKANARRVWIA